MPVSMVKFTIKWETKRAILIGMQFGFLFSAQLDLC